MPLSKMHLATLARACCLAVLCLLCASVATAAPVHRRVRGRVCDPHAATLKKLEARQASKGGPVAPPSTRALAGLTDPALSFQRANHTTFDDDQALIQNDTPAADVYVSLMLAPALEPIGFLARRIDRLPKLDACSLRSPRGPPPSA